MNDDVETGTLTISATSTKSGQQAEVTFEVPATVQGLVEKHGENIVYEAVLRSFRISGQSSLRSILDKATEDNVDELAEKFQSEWSPENAHKRKDKVARMADKAKDMTPEQIEALIKQLQSK